MHTPAPKNLFQELETFFSVVATPEQLASHLDMLQYCSVKCHEIGDRNPETFYQVYYDVQLLKEILQKLAAQWK